MRLSELLPKTNKQLTLNLCYNYFVLKVYHKNKTNHTNMFAHTLMNKFSQAGEDVEKMKTNFENCCGDMIFTRRHIARDMLTRQFYDEKEADKLCCYHVPFAEHVYNHPFGGSFSVHDDNVALVPLFQRFHILFETQAIELNLDLPSDAPLPIVKVIRSSGKIQDAWLKNKVSLRFSKKSTEWIPHIYLNFLNAPERTIEELCKAFYRKHRCDTKILDEFSVKEWQERETREGRSSVVFEIIDNKIKLTKAFVGYFVSPIQLDMDYCFIAKQIETIESIMTDRVFSKQISLAEFMQLNPTFNVKMKIHLLEVDAERNHTTDKMASILNELLEHQMKFLKKHTMLTDMDQFFNLITVE